MFLNTFALSGLHPAFLCVSGLVNYLIRLDQEVVPRQPRLQCHAQQRNNVLKRFPPRVRFLQGGNEGLQKVRNIVGVWTYWSMFGLSVCVCVTFKLYTWALPECVCVWVITQNPRLQCHVQQRNNVLKRFPPSIRFLKRKNEGLEGQERCRSVNV